VTRGIQESDELVVHARLVRADMLSNAATSPFWTLAADDVQKRVHAVIHVARNNDDGMPHAGGA
jgi:hypothetical protein